MRVKVSIDKRLSLQIEKLNHNRRYNAALVEDPQNGALLLPPQAKRPKLEKFAIVLDEGQLFWDIDDAYLENPGLFDRPFIHGLFDCYTFLQDYYRQIYNTELPTKAYEDQWWLDGKDYYKDSIEEAGFERVQAPLQAGDVIAMKINSQVINHTAVYVGDGKIAHHMSPEISCEEVFRPAYLRWAVGYFRHKDI